MYNQSVPYIVVKAFSFFFLLFSLKYFIYFLWLISIYNCKYYPVFLYFTNWLNSYSYSSLCLKCNLSQAKVVTITFIFKNVGCHLLFLSLIINLDYAILSLSISKPLSLKYNHAISKARCNNLPLKPRLSYLCNITFNLFSNLIF